MLNLLLGEEERAVSRQNIPGPTPLSLALEAWSSGAASWALGSRQLAPLPRPPAQFLPGQAEAPSPKRPYTFLRLDLKSPNPRRGLRFPPSLPKFYKQSQLKEVKYRGRGEELGADLSVGLLKRLPDSPSCHWPLSRHVHSLLARPPSACQSSNECALRAPGPPGVVHHCQPPPTSLPPGRAKRPRRREPLSPHLDH